VEGKLAELESGVSIKLIDLICHIQQALTSSTNIAERNNDHTHRCLATAT